MSLIFFYTVNCVKLAAEFSGETQPLFCQQPAQSWRESWHCTPCTYLYLEGNLLFPTSLIMKILKGRGVSTSRLSLWERIVVYLFIFDTLTVILLQPHTLCRRSHGWWGSFWRGQCAVGWGPGWWAGVWVTAEFLLQAWRDRDCDRGRERAFWRDQGEASCAAGESDHTFQVKAQSPGGMREEWFPHSSLL